VKKWGAMETVKWATKINIKRNQNAKRVSTYNNTITQYPCFFAPYLEGTEPVVLKPQP
jgi:hypothetical protein